MNIDELIQIASIISSLSGDATQGFILYLIYKALMSLVAWGVLLIAIYVVQKIIAPLVCSGVAYNVLGRIRDDLDVGAPGALTVSEMKEVRRAVARLRG